jgi:hypothetical protein
MGSGEEIKMTELDDMKRVPPSVEEFEKLEKSKLADPETAGDIIEAQEPWLPTDKVPGFEEMTFGIAKVYKIKWNSLEALRRVKALGFQAYVLSTPVGLFAGHGFNRQQWATIQQELALENEARFKGHNEAKSSQFWAQKDVEMRTEEFVALKSIILPEGLNRQTIRQFPAGVATAVARAAMQASMLEEEDTLPAVRL